MNVPAYLNYKLRITWKEAVKHKTCYLFMLPFAVCFAVFVIAPVFIAIFYSFTYFNILESPRFIGLRNYINLLLADDVFLISMKNTFVMAAITGQIGYVAAFLFAWFINELPRYIRAFVTLIFYAPSISGSVFLIWLLIFSGDAYGYVNAILLNLGILDSPVLWLTDPK